jgi:hypothetical protein
MGGELLLLLCTQGWSVSFSSHILSISSHLICTLSLSLHILYIGAITGIAQDGIGISEKVWMTYDCNPSCLQPGHYDGEPDVFVLRDILQQSQTRQQAEAYMASAERTFAIFVGVGDFESQRMDVVGYKEVMPSWDISSLPLYHHLSSMIPSPLFYDTITSLL